MRFKRTWWRAFLALMLVVLPLTAVIIVPAAGAADPVLYTQINNASIVLSPSGDYAAPNDTSDAQTADDFTIPNGAKWQITQVDVLGGTPFGSAPGSFNIFIYSDVTNAPGVVLFSATNLSYVAGGANYSIAVPSGPTLLEGTYWLVVQANIAGGQSWAWATRTTQDGDRAKFVNPANGLGTGCSVGWTNRTSCVAFSGNNEDQTFALFGLALPNLSPVNTVPGSQTVIDNATIVFSAANGNAISVNDPDIGTDNLSVTLTASHGTLTLPDTTGLSTVNGNGTANLFIFGSQAAINLRLNGLVYDPSNGYGGPDTLTMLSDDFGQNGTGGVKTDTDTVAIAVQARTIVDTVSGSIEYGGSNTTLTARLRTVDFDLPIAGQTLVFSVNGAVVCGGALQPVCPTTNASGIATFTGTINNPGLNVGNYANAVKAEFAGSAYFLASSGTGKLTVKRHVLVVKPIDRNVGLKQPNPPTNPPADCAATDDPTQRGPFCWLELADGSAFAPGEDWSDVNPTNIRFQYSRNYPYSNNTEVVDKTYRISVMIAASSNYTIRYGSGTLTVVPVTP